MNKEVIQEGWLIKSPPFKKIWNAKWRKRWFILIQSEIPDQYLLKYYKDQTCQKSKGVIDLNQCEQVDAGLRKSKLQYVFNIKTPQRTYFLAASNEEELNKWVQCICHVCGLHDLSDQKFMDSFNATLLNVANTSAEPLLNKTFRENSSFSSQVNNSTETTSDVAGQYGKTMQLSEVSFAHKTKDDSKNYVNYSSYMNKENNLTLNENDMKSKNKTQKRSTKTVPENLNFNECNNINQDEIKPPSPYIAISDCFSGSPTYMNHQLVTNENVQSHFIGQNLTLDQLYSPKRINYAKPVEPDQLSDQSGSTDSDNTDSLSAQYMGVTPEKDRRSTASSVQNEMDLSFDQRFSRFDSKYSDDVPVMPSPIIVGSNHDNIAVKSLNYQNTTESPKFLTESEITAQSTPFLSNNYENLTSIANILSTKSVAVEGSFFRYDFVEQPPIDRSMKPKLPPPNVNRQLKPQPNLPMEFTPNDETKMLQHIKDFEKLEYIDLLHLDSPPPISVNLPSPDVIQSIPSSPAAHVVVGCRRLHDSDVDDDDVKNNEKSIDHNRQTVTGTVYKTIDFIKTDAFNRTREDVELTRRKLSES